MPFAVRTIKSTYAAGIIVAALLAGIYLAACGGNGTGSANFPKSGAAGHKIAPVAIAGFADDPGNPGVQVVVTSANTLTAGALIVISGTTNYDGTYAVVSSTGTSFTITKAFVANDATGVWQTGGGVIAGCVTTGATGAIALSSVASRFMGVAPLAVFFDGTGTTATSTTRPFHDLEYRWDFDDALGSPVNGTTWGEGSRAGISSRNSATGPVSAHVFERPGTYTVALTVSNGANSVTNSCVQIVALDPDVVFAGAKTTCFSTSGTFTGCPADAATVTTSDFVVAMGSAAAQTRLLFRRGETWTAGASYTLSAAGPGIIGAYDVGTAPVVQMTGGTTLIRLGTGAAPTFADWRVMDLDIDLQSNAVARFLQATGNASRILFLRLHIHDGKNAYTFSDPSGAPPWDQIFIVDNYIHTIIGGVGGVGTFASAKRLAYLGNFVDDIIAAEHNIRFPYIGKGVLSNNTLSRPGVPGRANIKMHAPDFPTYSAYTEEVIVSDNKMSSNTNNWMFELQPQSRHNDERLRNIIVERNLFQAIAGFATAVISVSGSEITLRNNIIDITGSVALAGFSVGRFGLCAPECEPPPENIRIYNNTFYSSDSGVGLFFIELLSSISPASPTTVKNNLGYAPNITLTATFPQMIKDLATGTIASANSTHADVKSTVPAWFSLTPAVPADFALTAPSYIAGDATVPVFSDFFGISKPNTGATDIGATEF